MSVDENDPIHHILDYPLFMKEKSINEKLEETNWGEMDVKRRRMTI